MLALALGIGLTPSLNASFWRHKTSSGKMPVPENAFLKIHFSTSPSSTSPEDLSIPVKTFLGLLHSVAIDFATATNCLSKNGVLASRPCDEIDRSERNTSYKCISSSNLELSNSKASSVGALKKYKYEPNTSSDPSPLNTTLQSVLLAISLQINQLPTDALTDVISYDSIDLITSGIALKKSSGLETISVCSDPICSATFLA